MKFVCQVCGYVYDEEKEGKPFSELPDTWVCPVCGATNDMFKPQETEKAVKTERKPVRESDGDMKQLSAGELSVICSNLARGCEKQYEAEAQKLFEQLADYFGQITPEPENPTLERLTELISQNIDENYPDITEIAKEYGDRGTQRVCVWGEKVTKMIANILSRVKRDGDGFLASTNIWVCTMCGFIYIGDNAPDLCPVCKVPAWKFRKIEGRR